MIKVIVTALIYLLTMTLAYILKLAGLFSKEDKKTLSNLIFYVTLPASLISGFTDAKVNIYYVVAILTGFGVNTVMVIAGQIASRNKSRKLQAIYAVNASGYNMACIAIPFLSNFYTGGVPYLCMFDVGDSFYTLGTIYALAQVRLNQGNKSEKCNINLLYIIKSLFSSVPFVVYFTMTVLSFLNFHLPSVIVEIADFCGHGNGFLAMMMIGISLEINMSRDTFREVIHLLALRYAIGIVSAILIFCILPAPLVMRQILAAAVFSSSAAVSIIYSEKLGVPTDIAAALNPISTICMIPFMVIVIMLTM